MSGSTFGKLFRVTTWGESHGAAIGAVVDGCPAGLTLCEDDIQQYLNRRKPGQSKYTTKRQEADQVEILSGVFEGKTTGTPISLIVRNQDQRSRDYGNIAYTYRPGHADYTFTQKYGFRDYRGGGRSSGRETIGRVAAGAIASLLLNEMGITFTSYAKSVGPVTVPEKEYHFEEISENKLYMPNNQAAKQAASFLDQMIQDQDSCGGTIECLVQGLPAGLGEPVFEKLDAYLAQALMSIGAVKAVELGDGILAASSLGSKNNDAFLKKEDRIVKETNHSGGVLGGMSDGSPLLVRASIKPTPSISQSQRTVTESGEETELVIHGRHDPVIVPRAVVVVEAMTAITLADLLLVNMSSRLDKIKAYYTED
ncbi:chorismate synthase [Faecalicatena sp. AGMB00832]|uniref:Chorismate synthase n=1 Tax=Faecalicatena faecalis TaxID=2726362 RepID=A0ABS6D403_9FIRM|nr:chorismate synthase [Faecalicatena faecalis]MBU3876328.1 chorismate synthase [Faecalicatena faecalis]